LCHSIAPSQYPPCPLTLLQPWLTLISPQLNVSKLDQVCHCYQSVNHGLHPLGCTLGFALSPHPPSPLAHTCTFSPLPSLASPLTQPAILGMKSLPMALKIPYPSTASRPPSSCKCSLPLQDHWQAYATPCPPPPHCLLPGHFSVSWVTWLTALLSASHPHTPASPHPGRPSPG